MIKVWLQLATQYHQAGDLPRAEALYQQILQAEPRHSQALHFLGVLAAQHGQYEKALELVSQAIDLDSQVANFYNSLGNIYLNCYQPQAAQTCFQKTLELDPSFFEAYNNLGNVLSDLGSLSEARVCYQQAIALNPHFTEAYTNLGKVLNDLHFPTQAFACFQRALLLNPNYADTYGHLGNLLFERNQFTEAIRCYQQALALKPSLILAHHNLLYVLNLSPEYDAATILVEHQKFNVQHALPLLRTPAYRPSRSSPKLKIGYLSPDFHRHSVAYFMEAIFAHHRHDHFEIYGYHTSQVTDEVTRRFQSCADSWLNCATFSDAALAEKIQHDQIDILVDLTGHLANNRLLVLARKPAPIQVTYLGYPNTTGLTAIDYRITDNYADPPGREIWSCETLVRLPHSYFCYSPPPASPFVSPLPVLQKGYLTFGSFNNSVKFNPQLLRLWQRVLEQLPNSKLLIKTKNLDTLEERQILQDYLARCGLPKDRLILANFVASTQEHLEMYQQVDIGLDTYPYNGATTTCEALWMGVPVITWVGERHAARMGLSILATVGLTDLIAYTPEQYLHIAVKLANNLGYLQTLRQQLRERLQTSPLMDGLTFTRQLEELYRQFWQQR